MSFIEEIKNRAKKEIKTIVLPEATDLRTLTAVDTICKEGFAKVVLIGNEEKVTKLAKENGLDISKAKILIGYEPKTTFKEGIENFVKWYKENKNLYE